MIVADASVVIDYLLGPGSEAGDRLAQSLETEAVAVPHLVDVEVAHVFRRFVRRGEVSAESAIEYLAELARSSATSTASCFAARSNCGTT